MDLSVYCDKREENTMRKMYYTVVEKVKLKLQEIRWAGHRLPLPANRPTFLFLLLLTDCFEKEPVSLSRYKIESEISAM